jgi:chromosomal replication initiation ATPase DnaA
MNFQKNQKVVSAVLNYPILSSFGIIYGQVYTPLATIRNKKSMIKKHIFKFIQAKYAITEQQIIEHDRRPHKVELRQIICLYCRDNEFTLKAIGQILGGRDHSTVVNNLKKGNAYLQFEEQYSENYKAFVRSFDIYLSGI